MNGMRSSFSALDIAVTPTEIGTISPWQQGALVTRTRICPGTGPFDSTDDFGPG